MVKATTAEGDDIRRSFNWATARRGILKVMSDSLVCGDWIIPYDQIEDATLFSFWSLYLPGYILRVKTAGGRQDLPIRTQLESFLEERPSVSREA